MGEVEMCKDEYDTARSDAIGWAILIVLRATKV
jgi:hypothetical protein